MTSKYRETRNIVVKRAGRYWGDHSGEGKDITATIEIEIDLDQVAEHMGRRAALNKSRRTRDGFVTVKAHSVAPVD